MYNRFFIILVTGAFAVAVIYSSVSPDLYALKAKSVKLCEKNTADGITTETCCQLETDSSTEKTTQYCTECKTTSKGEDLGCTHSQTDVGLTISDGNLGIQNIGPKTSTDKLSDNKVQVPNRFDLKNDKFLTKDNEVAPQDSQVTTDEVSKDNDTSIRKELEDQDKLGNFEIQDLMSDYKNDTRD